MTETKTERFSECGCREREQQNERWTRGLHLLLNPRDSKARLGSICGLIKKQLTIYLFFHNLKGCCENRTRDLSHPKRESYH